MLYIYYIILKLIPLYLSDRPRASIKTTITTCDGVCEQICICIYIYNIPEEMLCVYKYI